MRRRRPSRHRLAPTPLEAGFERSESILARLPIKRFGKPEDVAGMALYLASPASDYITGTTFLVDGGMNVATAMG